MSRLIDSMMILRLLLLITLISNYDIVSGQYGPGLNQIPGSPYVSAGFGMTITINGPHWLPINGKLAYTPSLQTTSIRATGPVTYQLLPPNSADLNSLGCNKFNRTVADDGTPLAGAALVVLRGVCT